jgi:hypothetical protein
MSRKRHIECLAGVLRDSSMIFRPSLGSTDATAAPPKLISHLKSGSYDLPRDRRRLLSAPTRRDLPMAGFSCIEDDDCQAHW